MNQLNRPDQNHYSESNKHKHYIILIFILIILAPILQAIYINYFGVNIIYWDEWDDVPLIQKVYTGTFTLNDFFTLFNQHNEHRPFFPLSIHLILAYITKLNSVAEMYVSWAFALITLLLIIKMNKSDFGNNKSLVIIVPVAWLIFSFRQSETILWGGAGIGSNLTVLGFVASIYMLENSEKINYKFIMSIFCGIISSFSLLMGLFVWPAGFVLITLLKNKNKRNLAVVWAMIGIIVWSSYFYNWRKVSGHPSPFFAVENLGNGLAYFMINIGAPLALEISSAFGMGIVLTILIIITGMLLIKNKLVAKNATWIAFILFSLASSFAMTIGRSGFGVGQALASRYVAFTVLGIIGLYFIIFNLDNKNQKYAILYGMILSIIFVGIIIGYAGGIKIGSDTLDARTSMTENLLYYKWASDENLKPIFPDASRVRDKARFLEEYGLNAFSSFSLKKNPHYQIPEWHLLKRVPGGIMVIDSVDSRLFSNINHKIDVDKNLSKFIYVIGWAVDDLIKDGRVKTFFILKDDNEEIVIPTKKMHRPDVADSLGTASYEQSGWSATIRSMDFKTQCYNISVRILRGNNEEYFELAGEKPICFG